MYNSGWANLKPQESKYTPALALQAAKLLEAGTSLSATAVSYTHLTLPTIYSV